MSEENQTPKQAVVEVIQDPKSDNYKASANSSLNSLTNFLDDLFNKKMPKLPKGFLDFMVQYMPIFNIIGMVYKGVLILTGILGMIAILGTLLYFKSALYFVGVASSLISIVGAGIALYFAYKAMSNMEAKKLTSWNNIYYGWLSAIVFGILANLTSIGNSAAFSYDYASGVPLAIATTTVVFSTLIAIAIDFLILYIIFQIKSYYKN